MIILLLDADNFYYTVESVFDASLRGKPVVVLSSNDANIIARSPSAKKLGIPMGAPVFEYRNLMAQHSVIQRSSNFALYGSMSERMLRAIELFFEQDKIEKYSIDEVFINASHIPTETLLPYARKLRDAILRLTGLSVSIGIATTKTLAKISIEIAKKEPEYRGVHSLVTASEEEIDAILEKTYVEDIWGIGKRSAMKLALRGIITGKALKNADIRWIRKHLSVVGERIVYELRSVSCLPVQSTFKPKQGILTSQSFWRPITPLNELEKAIAFFVTKASEKLRDQESLCGMMSVFIQTNRFLKDEPQYTNTASTPLFPTAFTPDLILIAQQLTASIYRDGYRYKRAGVYLTHITSRKAVQYDLFGDFSEDAFTKQERLMCVVDGINSAMGSSTLYFGALGLYKEGEHPAWKTKQSYRSHRATTQWNELLTVT